MKVYQNKFKNLESYPRPGISKLKKWGWIMARDSYQIRKGTLQKEHKDATEQLELKYIFIVIVITSWDATQQDAIIFTRFISSIFTFPVDGSSTSCVKSNMSKENSQKDLVQRCDFFCALLTMYLSGGRLKCLIIVLSCCLGERIYGLTIDHINCERELQLDIVKVCET